MATASEVVGASCLGRFTNTVLRQRLHFMLHKKKNASQKSHLLHTVAVHELASNSFVAISNDVGEKLMKIGLQTQLVTAHFASTATILAWNMQGGSFLADLAGETRAHGLEALALEQHTLIEPAASCRIFSPFRQE